MTKTAQPIVTVDARGCLFSVVGNQESMPATFFASIRKAKAMELLLIGGGVKGFKPEHSAQMKPWILEGLKGFVGVAFSGGTAYYDKETGALKSDIVTSIPAYLAAENECVAIGTFPRVADWAFDRDHGHMYTDAYGAVVDNRYHHVAAVQRNASEVLDWDGDMERRFTVVDALTDWTKAYLIINGGAVTRDAEIYAAIAKGIPVIVAEGSFREADALVAALKGDWTLTAAEERAKAGEDKAKIEKVDAIVARCQGILKGKEGLVNVVKYGDSAALNATAKKLGLLGGEGCGCTD
jgi:hypothetical protein